MKRFLTWQNKILFAILILAAILRFWNLGSVPPTASSDEASIAYNAYSVLKTGGDEFGKFPLISQQGYDDYRRSTYLLLVVPFVGLFGLNVVSERLPAAILSLLTVWATYEIILLLFTKKNSFSYGVAFLGTFLLAISPWHIYISRLGHESNTCLSFFVFAILFFLKGLQKKYWFVLSLFFFTLAIIGYYSGQALVPLFGLGLVLIFGKELWTTIIKDKKILLPVGLVTIFLIACLWAVFSPASLIRFRGTSTFDPNAHWDMFHKEVLLHNQAISSHNLLGEIYYNRRMFPLKVFIIGYFDHFKPSFLFGNSGDAMFKAPNMGLLYWWELPFIFVGFFMIFKTKKISGKKKSLLYLWFFLAPIPAAIATQTPHAMRAYNFLPTWQVFCAFGITYVVYMFKKFRIITVPIIIILAIAGLVSFIQNYFIVFPKHQSHSFEYAFSKALPYVFSIQNNYKKIIFSNKDSMYQSYMVFLYYDKFDPALYQRLGGTKSGGYAETHSFEKYEFRPINFAKDSQLKNVLLIGNVNEFPKIVKGNIFTDLDGNGGVKVVAIKDKIPLITKE
ncbi:MAG TPA: glycosyltransferase family 39 protein [Patescibacteria group bacterium]